MWFSQVLGWGIPVIGLIILLVFSGVSFRFGATCHINHENSLADFWIPLLVFAGLTVIIQFATFGYCIKVYLASLTDNSTTTEGSGMPSYSNSIRTMTPRQAYRRIRRVVQLQWRGIVIVLIIIADVIFFAVIFVFLDNTVESVRTDPEKALPWAACLIAASGDKNKCLDKAKGLVVSLPTVTAVLILLAVSIAKVQSIMFCELMSKIDERPLVIVTARSLVYGHRLGRFLQGSGWTHHQEGICVCRRSNGY